MIPTCLALRAADCVLARALDVLAAVAVANNAVRASAPELSLSVPPLTCGPIGTVEVGMLHNSAFTLNIARHGLSVSNIGILANTADCVDSPSQDQLPLVVVAELAVRANALTAGLPVSSFGIGIGIGGGLSVSNIGICVNVTDCVDSPAPD